MNEAKVQGFSSCRHAKPAACDWSRIPARQKKMAWRHADVLGRIGDRMRPVDSSFFRLILMAAIATMFYIFRQEPTCFRIDESDRQRCRTSSFIVSHERPSPTSCSRRPRTAPSLCHQIMFRIHLLPTNWPQLVLSRGMNIRPCAAVCVTSTC
jgi:hypothetical protein